MKNLIINNKKKQFEGIINNKPHLATLVGVRGMFFRSKNYSLLHVACSANNISAIKVLIKNDASVNAMDSLGYTPIQEAAHYGCTECVRCLLGHDKTLVNSVTESDKLTPLHIAAQRGKEDVVKYLLMQPNIDVNFKDSDNQMADQYWNESIKQMIRKHRLDSLK